MQFFDYFQIVSLGVFLAVFSGRTVWLNRRGSKVFVLGQGKQGVAVFIEKSFLIFFPVWIVQVVIQSLGIDNPFLATFFEEPMFINPYGQSAGAAMILAAQFIFILALAAFKLSWRVGIDAETPGALVTTGIFRLSRNPIFLSMDLYFLGSFLISSNVFFLACFVLMASGIHLQILQEEKFLIRQYGGDYLKYRESVRRYM